MKYGTVILPAAKADLKDAAKWYNQIRPGLGNELVKQLRKRLGEIKNIR